VAIFAGSDTTAIAMRSIFYHLMKNPASYEKLVAEIDAATRGNNLSSPTIKFAEAVKLPYFVACCKEGMRLHPSVGMSMPRNVPPGGKMISGRFYSEGSRVGVNAFVLHFNQDIFGKDADSWNPDRWLQPGGENMDRYMLHFGAGPRTCAGKNVHIISINVGCDLC
jgi:cytochrome P450